MLLPYESRIKKGKKNSYKRERKREKERTEDGEMKEYEYE